MTCDEDKITLRTLRTERKNYRKGNNYSAIVFSTAVLIGSNPLSPSIKLQIFLLCFHTVLTQVAGRSC